MPTQLRSWTRSTYGRMGVTVTCDAVELWRGEASNVKRRFPLASFAHEQVGVSETEFVIGARQAAEVIAFVADLMESHRDYVD